MKSSLSQTNVRFPSPYVLKSKKILSNQLRLNKILCEFVWIDYFIECLSKYHMLRLPNDK